MYMYDCVKPHSGCLLSQRAKCWFLCVLFQTQIQEIVSQAVYKDKKILELNQKILDNEKIVLDLQEHISEKAQVIAGRDKAVQVSNAQRSSSSLLP